MKLVYKHNAPIHMKPSLDYQTPRFLHPVLKQEIQPGPPDVLFLTTYS